MTSTCNKVAYASPALACEAAKYIMKKMSGKELRAYPCPICKAWHLSSKRGNKSRYNKHLE